MDFLKNIAQWFLPVFAMVFLITEIYRAVSLRGKEKGERNKDKLLAIGF